MTDLRPYQQQAVNDTFAKWRGGARNVLLVKPTGSGKTHTKTRIMKLMDQPGVAIAHRQELVLQISSSLAQAGMYHNLIAPEKIIGFCVAHHMKKFGKNFYATNAKFSVGGVRTILNRRDKLKQWASDIRMWDIDEAHHCLPDNQWGEVVGMFSNAYGLGVTATPERCDRQGLDGIFDEMVVGPTMRDLIDMGYLSDYRIFCPPQSLNMARIRVSSSSGEYVKKDLIQETERSTIVGDVVGHYQRLAPGKRGLTFAVDVASGEHIAQAYNDAGVRAAMVTAKTPDNIRMELLERLATGDILQIVNVDLFGEGMDCPAIEVVSMARPTQSYGLYVQQFGRALRPLAGKSHATIIDHVGNVVRHGLPDAPRPWSLTAPDRRSRHTSDAIKLTSCTACLQPYACNLSACPHCGERPEPVSRSEPKYVEGDLVELDPDVLRAMRGEIARIDGPPDIPFGATEAIAGSVLKNWRRRQTAQAELRDVMATWFGKWHFGHGETTSMLQRRFWHSFGVDVASAQALGVADAEKLKLKIMETL